MSRDVFPRASDPITLLAELVRELEELRARVTELEQREPPPRWLTIDQTAAYLDTTPKAIRRRADRGRLPIVRDGRRIYVDRLALDTMFAAKESMLGQPTQKAPATVTRPGARPQEVGLP